MSSSVPSSLLVLILFQIQILFSGCSAQLENLKNYRNTCTAFYTILYLKICIFACFTRDVMGHFESYSFIHFLSLVKLYFPYKIFFPTLMWVLHTLGLKLRWTVITAQKMKFSIKDFLSKCDQIFNGKLHFLWRPVIDFY